MNVYYKVKMRSVRTISRKDFDQKLGWFLAGFVEGEGSFNVSLRKKDDYKVGWQVVLSFNVSQKDVAILELLRKELNCGIIKVRKYDGIYSLDVTNIGDIIEKIIPFFEKFKFFSKEKIRNFEIFSQIAKLMKNGQHRNKNGLKAILLLREELNKGKGRKRKYQINDIFSVKESSETIRQGPMLHRT